MDLPQLIDALSQPGVYPEPARQVETRQTHISVVFLLDTVVYKVKKPVKLEFLDFSTLQQRHHDCEQEVRLNRRLAPSVYLGVVPITQTPSGVQVEGDGEVIDWAVKMRRLPENANFAKRLAEGRLDRDDMQLLAQRLAAFHNSAETSPAIAAFGDWEHVAANASGNFTETVTHIGITVDPEVHQRLLNRTKEHLHRLRSRIEQRQRRNMPRDTHGDARLEHVYRFPDQPPPDDLVVIDCIEFNERFRYADPVADLAFLLMDLLFADARPLANELIRFYFAAANDPDGEELLPFYVAYRALVRAKVEGIQALEPEVTADERRSAQERARAHWLLALGQLEPPRRRPCLLLVGGLPGTGKSTLAAELGTRASFTVLRSDVIRKELAQGVAGVDLYSDAWSDRVYDECRQRAERALLAGERVLVDANFRQQARRQPFLELARRLAVPVRFLVCQADPGLVQDRLAQREDDVSDADWAVYQQLASQWEEPGPVWTGRMVTLDTEPEQEATCESVCGWLQAEGFLGPAYSWSGEAQAIHD